MYNTANISARTLIENTDRKMINYRATMSLMSNSEPASSHSETLSHMHSGVSTSVHVVSKERCVERLADGGVSMERTVFLSDQIPQCPTDRKLVD